MYFWIPALFSVGNKVRRLYWEGRIGGSARGDLARSVLEQCLLIHVHLLGDWECKAEYTRSISVALLQWQPSYSQLPGCCFVEEACEAMLSRMVGRCRANAQLTSFIDIQRLFMTMPLPSAEPKGTRGSVQQSLVFLMTSRLQSLISNPASAPFAKVQSGRLAVWQQSYPGDFEFPNVVALTTNSESRLRTILQTALFTVSSGRPVTVAVSDFLSANVPVVTNVSERASRAGAMRRISEWGVRRRQRQQSQTSPTQSMSQANVATSSSVIGVVTGEAAPVAAPAQLVAQVHPQCALDQPAVQHTTGDDHAEPSEGSLYEPPPTDDALSAGYESFGDTDSLGSVGDLVVGDAATWRSLEDDGLFDYLPQSQFQGMSHTHCVSSFMVF